LSALCRLLGTATYPPTVGRCGKSIPHNNSRTPHVRQLVCTDQLCTEQRSRRHAGNSRFSLRVSPPKTKPGFHNWAENLSRLHRLRSDFQLLTECNENGKSAVHFPKRCFPADPATRNRLSRVLRGCACSGSLFVCVLPCADLITRVSIRIAVMPDRFPTYSLRRTAFCQHVAIARIRSDRILASRLLPLLFNSLPESQSGTPSALSVLSGRTPGTETGDVANGIS